jgi:hypothetical protein
MNTSINQLYRCFECGDPLRAHEVAAEHENFVGSTAGTRAKSVSRYCADCHAAGEYAQHTYRLRLQAELKAEIEAARAGKSNA